MHGQVGQQLQGDLAQAVHGPDGQLVHVFAPDPTTARTMACGRLTTTG